VNLVDNDLLAAIASRLDLREPNRLAIETLAAELRQHYEVDQRPPPFEGVIDLATGVGKTYILAGALEYLAATGVRNFAVITPGKTILDKTVANFTPGHPKSLLGGMETSPVVITSENFNTAAMRSAMDDPTQVKLFIFTVQALTRPNTETGRKTHKFQEGLGRAFYDHLAGQDDLVVFADEHHAYFGNAFSAAVRDLLPWALVGLTATPHPRTPPEQIIFRYPLAAAIADRLVKTPVLVGRKDDRTDPATKLLDGVRLIEAKAAAITRYCAETGAEPVNPVMLVIAQTIEEAEEHAALIRAPSFAGGRYVDAVLVVHSKKPDEDLAVLASVEDDDSPVRIIVSVGMLKEGWDVKNVYAIASMRKSVSEILTEQTLGRGLRLPFGAYTDWELLDTLEVLAHERYEDLLRKARVINEAFIDYRTRAVLRRNAQGQEISVIETVPVSVAVAVEPEPLPGGDDPVVGGDQSGGDGGRSGPLFSGVAEPAPGRPVVETVETRQAQAQTQAEVAVLEPRPGLGQLVIPELRMTAVQSPFSLADIIATEPFRNLGQRLARDPIGELRRIRLTAHVVQTLDGMRHTELAPGKTIDRVESPASLIPLEDAIKSLADQILASQVVPARKGQRAQLTLLLDAFLAGLDDQAELVLSSYLDRAVAGFVQLVGEEQRKFAAKPSFDEVLSLHSFAPKRYGKPITSTDRYGAFRKGVGYTGWQRSLYDQVWFDSATERQMANLIDGDTKIDVWARLHINDLPIRWDGGTYNPDFLVAAGTDRWVIETKADRDLQTDSVQGKRQAAARWANHVTAADEVHERWHYLLVGETDLNQARDDWDALVVAAA
jgi:type III restriction enzyme